MCPAFGCGVSFASFLCPDQRKEGGTPEGKKQPPEVDTSGGCLSAGSEYIALDVVVIVRLSKLLWIITTIATLPAGAYTRPNGGVNFVFVRQEENTRASRVRY